MPDYTIETTFHLPVFRHRTYSAETTEAACRLAVEDGDWSSQKEDRESSGESYVTGIWQGADTAHSGTAVPVPPHFGEALRRQAGHFEILLGLLKIMFRGRRGRPGDLPAMDWQSHLGHRDGRGHPGRWARTRCSGGCGGRG